MKTYKIEGFECVISNDAAKMLNVSRQRISKLCKTGRLRSFKIGSSVLVPVTDIEAYAKHFSRKVDNVNL